MFEVVGEGAKYGRDCTRDRAFDVWLVVLATHHDVGVTGHGPFLHDHGLRNVVEETASLRGDLRDLVADASVPRRLPHSNGFARGGQDWRSHGVFGDEQGDCRSGEFMVG